MIDDPDLIDPSDGLPALECGRWAVEEKHPRLQRYVDASRAARAKWLPPKGHGGAFYVELFAGPGRVFVRDTRAFADGSGLVVAREAARTSMSYTGYWLGDVREDYLTAHQARLTAIGQNVRVFPGAAEKAAAEIAAQLPRSGLHFAFLDPFDLDTLPFAAIEPLAKLQRMDMLIHVSVSDLQRNLERYIQSNDCPLDRFAPGWRKVVTAASQFNVRLAILEHWLSLLRGLGLTDSKGIELVSGGKKQPLYWLVFAARNNLAHKLWDAVRDVGPQRDLI